MLFFDLNVTLLDFKGAEYAAVQSFHRELKATGSLSRM